MDDFDYSEYSLKNLDEWIHDSLNANISPIRIYDTIVKAIEDNINYHKSNMKNSVELFSMLSQNKLNNFDYCDNNDTSEYCKNSWNDFWQEGQSQNVTKNSWTIPVEVDDVSGDYFITIPNKVLERLSWKENDELEWVDADGFIKLQKVSGELKNNNPDNQNA